MQFSAGEYNQFRRLLEQKSGILLGENKQYLVSSRLTSFMKDNKIESLSALLSRINTPSCTTMMQKIIDLMTTNETLWFRDNYPFQFMKNTVIPEMKKRGHFRIWCAACSSGQEPYSLSMLLDETASADISEIIATDLSSRILDRAKSGIFYDIELKRGMPDDKLERYFSRLDATRWQINKSMRDSIQFQTYNLLKLPYTRGKFDVIFCRNVLIYFSKENKKRVLDGLTQSLKPGGYLVLGASESLIQCSSSLEMHRCNPGLVYRKP